MKFIIAKNYSLILEYLALEFGLNINDIILGEQVINKIKPESSLEIEYSVTDSSGGLFGEKFGGNSGQDLGENLFGEEDSKSTVKNSQANYILVDIKNIGLKNLDFTGLNKVSNSNQNSTKIILFDSENEVNAEAKKFLKSNSIEILELKTPDITTKNSFIKSYSSKVINKLDSSKQNQIISKISTFCDDYYGIVNWLDFVSLASGSEISKQNWNQILELLTPEESVMTFKLGLKDTKKWMINDEGELQKNLSILATKSQSQNLKKTIQNVINADKNVKTRSKIKSLTWYKLLLWQIKKDF